MRTARRIVVAIVTGLFLVSISSHLTWAAIRSGGLDPTFGLRGKVLTDFGGSESANALAIQSDGKIVVAGNSILARYNSRGRLDRQFGAQGKVLADLGVAALAIQSDGKIVTVGLNFGESGTADFALARYNPDGSLDSTFNATGKVLTDFGGNNDGATALAIQSDGKIVVAGASRVSGLDDFALARYNPDGTLDSTFNATGKVLTDVLGEDDVAYAVAVQSDGKIVAAGYSFDPIATSDDLALVRYTPDGTLDATFNGTGKVLTDFGGSDSYEVAYDLAIQSDGKIVAAGHSFDRTSQGFALVRYNLDGALDATFNATGKVVTDFSGSGEDVAYALAIQSDGKIVAAGYTFVRETDEGREDDDFALARYTPDGSLDTMFNATGMVLTDFTESTGPEGFDRANALAIQSDGKIVAAGFSGRGQGTGLDFALARYFP